ncbi:hypothetical protein [Streptosporangium amethystogenes]|uniref:hypothetical protein n=1 Tax=Streptosporangium amethystogenes TaxID=2002 RepID=UPI0004C540F1|nr:hypothetical protein [Streptosporangium amethystogenes]
MNEQSDVPAASGADQRSAGDPRRGGAPVSLLEERYRYWLRLLPASYRAEREEEMVSVFLEGSPDVSDADGPRPRWSEIASVAALAVRVRLGGAGAGPRSLSWGETVRLVALLGLLFQAFLAVLTIVAALNTYGVIGTVHPSLAQEAGPLGSFERLANILRSLAGAVWIAPFVALVLGHVRTAKALALLAFVPELHVLTSSAGGTFEALAGLLSPLVVLSALWTGFHRDARPARRPLWLLAPPLAAGIAVSVLFRLVASPDTPAWWWPWLDLLGLASTLILGAGVGYVCVHLRSPAWRTPSWPLALAILAVPVLCARLARFEHGFDAADEVSRTIMLGTLGQTAALLLVALVLAVLGFRALPAARGPSPEPPRMTYR